MPRVSQRNGFYPAPRSCAGFTLIEMLVVFSLVSVVSGIGFASFMQYSRRQSVVQAAADFKQTLDLARFNALSSVKPESCGTAELTDFKFKVCMNTGCLNTVNDSYEITVGCGTEKLILSKKLAQNITLSYEGSSIPCSELTFSRSTGVTLGTPCEIYVNGYNNPPLKIEVDSNGQASY